MSLADKARDAILAARAQLIELSHFVHAHPELGYEEFESAEAVATALENAGFSLERGVAGLPTAFRATYGSGKSARGVLRRVRRVARRRSRVRSQHHRGLLGGCGHRTRRGRRPNSTSRSSCWAHLRRKEAAARSTS